MAKPLTGRRTLAIFLVSFGVVFAVNGYMIAEAVKTFRGEAVSSFHGESENDEYLQGVNFNDTLARRAEQKALGWQANIGAARDSRGLVRIELRVKTRAGSPVDGLKLDGVLRHPSDAHRDRPLAFAEKGAGAYEALASHVTPGAWDVEVRSGSRGAPFEASRGIWLQ